MSDPILSDHILLAVITGAHGIKGEVRLKSFTQEPKRLVVLSPLHDGLGRAFTVASLRPQKDQFIARLKNVTDRNAAEALRGVELFGRRQQLPELKSGEVYVHDLIGSDVVLVDGTKLGVLIAIPNYGAGDLLEIERPDERETLLVPFAKEFVPDQDFSNRVITVTLPENYLSTDEKDHDEPV